MGKAAAVSRGKAARRMSAMKSKKISRVLKSSAKAGKFDGKLKIDAEGCKALNRKFTDAKAWAGRRRRERAPPGGWPKPPSHWPPGVRVDIRRPVYWLPEGWGQGVKTTCVTRLECFVSPEGKAYYHRHVVEQVHGEKLGRPDNPEKVLQWARKFTLACIAEGTSFDRKIPVFEDKRLLATLTKKERSYLPVSAAKLHFAVISARRADNERGMRGIAAVETQLRAEGAKPVWYVDADSLQAYKKLGLDAKVGGKLVQARNMALQDAEKLRKPCVQVSDDILHWHYWLGDLGKVRGLEAGNEAAKNADKLRITPGAAARYLLARLRAAQSKDGSGPRLAGVFPLGNVGMAFNKEAITTDNFILGDFFVADSSACRFDKSMTLKEDYDYTCSHLARHGSVLRCNRLFAAAQHQTNEGGAVSFRDKKGNKERENIAILQRKWPGAFRLNSTRGGGDTEVIMVWKRHKPERSAK